MGGCKNRDQGHKTGMNAVKYEGKYERIVREN
jgi:hypothetical protein